jgi:hypothetical protein
MASWSPLSRFRAVSAGWAGVVFGLLVLGGDLWLRLDVLPQYHPRERNQYLLSMVGCLLFWTSMGQAWAAVSRLERPWRWLSRPALGLFCLLLLALPLAHYALYRKTRTCSSSTSGASRCTPHSTPEAPPFRASGPLASW